MKRAYEEERELGYLDKPAPAKRQRLRLPDRSRRRITGGTEKKMALARALMKKLPAEATRALVDELAPNGAPLPTDPLLDRMRQAIRDGAIHDEAVYRLEHGIDQPSVDAGRDGKGTIGHTRRDRKGTTGHTDTSGSPRAKRLPKGSSLRDRGKVEDRKAAGEPERSAGQLAARKGGSDESTVEHPTAPASSARSARASTPRTVRPWPPPALTSGVRRPAASTSTATLTAGSRRTRALSGPKRPRGQVCPLG